MTAHCNRLLQHWLTGLFCCCWVTCTFMSTLFIHILITLQTLFNSSIILAVISWQKHIRIIHISYSCVYFKFTLFVHIIITLKSHSNTPDFTNLLLRQTADRNTRLIHISYSCTYFIFMKNVHISYSVYSFTWQSYSHISNLMNLFWRHAQLIHTYMNNTLYCLLVQYEAVCQVCLYKWCYCYLVMFAAVTFICRYKNWKQRIYIYCM